MSRFPLLTITALLAWLSGCATPGDAEVPSGEDPGAVRGYLSVERTSPWNSDTQRTRETASATFLRLQEGGDPSMAARLVGASLDLPPDGTCSPLEVVEPTVPLRTLNPVELLRVGDVTVRSNTSSTRLVARAYPDVAHLISGVVYTSSGRETPGVSGQVVFDIGGTEGIPGFTVDVPMPSVVEKLSLNGVEVNDERDWLTFGDAVELQWHATEEDISLPSSLQAKIAPDRFFVDLSVVDARQIPRTLRCSGGAEARFQVPLRFNEQTQSVTLTAHRLRTVQLTSSSQLNSEIRLDSARSATIRLGEGDAAR